VRQRCGSSFAASGRQAATLPKSIAGAAAVRLDRPTAFAHGRSAGVVAADRADAIGNHRSERCEQRSQTAALRWRRATIG
jgi:hypothetical protein